MPHKAAIWRWKQHCWSHSAILLLLHCISKLASRGCVCGSSSFDERLRASKVNSVPIHKMWACAARPKCTILIQSNDYAHQYCHTTEKGNLSIFIKIWISNVGKIPDLEPSAPVGSTISLERSSSNWRRNGNQLTKRPQDEADLCPMITVTCGLDFSRKRIISPLLTKARFGISHLICHLQCTAVELSCNCFIAWQEVMMWHFESASPHAQYNPRLTWVGFWHLPRQQLPQTPSVLLENPFSTIGIDNSHEEKVALAAGLENSRRSLSFLRQKRFSDDKKVTFASQRFGSSLVPRFYENRMFFFRLLQIEETVSNPNGAYFEVNCSLRFEI